MSGQANPYRTLIRGVLEQTSGLSVGGTASFDGSASSCYRDGSARLTIPGSGLAGALIETAARIFPRLIDEDDSRRLLGQQITGKERTVPQQGNDKGTERFKQSVWRVFNAHPHEEPNTEWRQGVGIRQASGASAGEKKALFDVEFVPVGTHWDLLLEIDTFRAGAEAEALAIIALGEWAEGRGWLGRSAGNGTGWVRFPTDDSVQVVRIPKIPELIEMWPDNTKLLSAQFDDVVDRLRGSPSREYHLPSWEQALKDARELVRDRFGEDMYGEWRYLSFSVILDPGPAAHEYGWDVLQVGGHPAVTLYSEQAAPLVPLSTAMPRQEEATDEEVDCGHWPGGDFKQPNSPFVTTRPTGEENERPYVPGSGMRGPLRHTASRLARGRRCADCQRPMPCPEQRWGRAGASRCQIRDPN